VKLENVVKAMDENGLDCFLLSSKPRVWRLTGCAWETTTFEYFQGSNVLCVQKGHPWWYLAEAWAITDPLEVVD